MYFTLATAELGAASQLQREETEQSLNMAPRSSHRFHSVFWHLAVYIASLASLADGYDDGHASVASVVVAANHRPNDRATSKPTARPAAPPSRGRRNRTVVDILSSMVARRQPRDSISTFVPRLRPRRWSDAAEPPGPAS